MQYPEQDYPAEALDEERRRGMVLARIRQAMSERRLIVLHEVDIKLRGILEAEAFNGDYGIACNGHGYWRNWYMGSAVMWPRFKEGCNEVGYDLKSIEYLVPGDRIRSRVEDPTPPPSAGLSSWMWWALTPVTSGYRWATGTKPDKTMTLGECYREAVKRSNVLIHIELGELNEDRPVHVWAYHMPCAFRNPPIMQYHADELVHTVRHAKDGVHLLCMDGNFRPYTELYNTFIEAGFTSASFAALRNEPAWTCHSKSEWGGAFTDTLDYIWHLDNEGGVTRTFKVEFAQIDHAPDEDVPYLPCVTFPSDHLWMDFSITTMRD